VSPNLVQTFPSLVPVGALLRSLLWIVARHGISILPERTLDERVDARDVPDEVFGYVVAAGEVGGGVVAHQHPALAFAPDQDLQRQVQREQQRGGS
jgi:hypothetical protein